MPYTSLSTHLYVCIHTDLPLSMLQAPIHWAPFKWKYWLSAQTMEGSAAASSSEHNRPHVRTLTPAKAFSPDGSPRKQEWCCCRGPISPGRSTLGTHLLEHAVEGLRAADVKADEHSIRVRVGQGTDVIVVR